MRARTFLRALAKRALGLALACWATASWSGSLGVSPIRVELDAATPTAALTLENSGNAPMVLQLQVMRWTAADDEDRYQPSEELVAMPPITTIGPGERQVVRMGLIHGPDAQREQTYRLYIEEVPPPPKPGYQGLQVALRVGVPVFVAPTAPAAPRLEWHARLDRNGILALRVSNTGNAHQRLLVLKLRTADGQRVLATQQAVGDLLPGQTREWQVGLGDAVPDGRLRLTVETDRGPIDVELDPDKP